MLVISLWLGHAESDVTRWDAQQACKKSPKGELLCWIKRFECISMCNCEGHLHCSSVL